LTAGDSGQATGGRSKTFRSRKILSLKDGGEEEQREGGKMDTKIYLVIEKETGKVKSTHSTRELALEKLAGLAPERFIIDDYVFSPEPLK